MNYCQNCGNEIGRGTRFCSHCGQNQQTSMPVSRQSHSAGKKHIHCPECRSTALSPIVETEVNGGISSNYTFSRRGSIGSVAFNNIHRNYWVCGDCGHKFRNLQNLKEEIATLTKNQKNTRIFTIAYFVLVLFCLVIDIPILSALFCYLFAVLAFLFLGLYLHYTLTLKKLVPEKAYLEDNCYH